MGVPKQNINYLHYNYINFFTTTTTTATILCVIDQRLLWCEHCKRTFFERLRRLVPLLWNLTSRCEIEKLCHFQEREKRKSVVHIATLLVFLNSSINFVWYYQSEKVHRSSSCHDFSLLVIRSSHHYTIHLKNTHAQQALLFIRYSIYSIHSKKLLK